MKNLIFAILVSVPLIGCTSLYNPNLTSKTKIEIPQQIRHGECEKDRAILTGDTAKDLIIYASQLIDHIDKCQIEKASILKQIDLINEELK